MTGEPLFVFLMCSERSGGNLMTRIVDAHPEFCGPSPSHMIRVFSRNLFRYGDLKEDVNWQTLINDVVALLNSQLGIWATQWEPQRLLAGVKERNLASIIRFVYAEEAKENGKRHVMIKENRLHLFLPFVLEFFRDAKFVWVVRDPRDMALSHKISPNHPDGVLTAAALWKEDQARSIEISSFLQGTGRLLRVRYEDLVSRTEEETKRVCEFLGVRYAGSMLDFHRNDMTRRNAERLENWANLKKPIMQKNFNKYQKQLSEPEIRYVESFCREEMEFLGYVPDFPETGGDIEVLKNVVSKMESSGGTTLSGEEMAIRERRLEVVLRIVGRRLYKSESIVHA